jgi:myosin heavy subunit
LVASGVSVLQNIASLLKVPADALEDSLVTRTSVTRGEKFITPLTKDQVRFARGLGGSEKDGN